MLKMKTRTLVPCALLAAVACWSGAAVSQDATPRKFSGEYSFYSGAPGERAIATKKDTKVAMSVGGPLASRMFDSMGGRAKIDSCEDVQETRMRDELLCTRDKDGKAYCYFGFDLHSGKSVLGIEC
jgi:hypothetical protein